MNRRANSSRRCPSARVPELLQGRSQRLHVILDRGRGLAGFARAGGGGVVGVSHHGTIGRIGVLRELHQQIGCEPARFRQALQRVSAGVTHAAAESWKTSIVRVEQGVERRNVA
jgi:hypothetical protein